MFDGGYFAARLRDVESLIEGDPRLQPTLESEALQRTLQLVLSDLQTRKTRYPAESISRHLTYGGVMAHTAPILMRAGLTPHLSKYREWWAGLSAPPMLLDQAFAAISLGSAPVLEEIDKVLASPDGAQGHGRWWSVLIRSNVERAEHDLRHDSSGAGVLDRFVRQQLGQRGDVFFDAGLFASWTLHMEFLAAAVAKGFHPSPPVLEGRR